MSSRVILGDEDLLLDQFEAIIAAEFGPAPPTRPGDRAGGPRAINSSLAFETIAALQLEAA